MDLGESIHGFDLEKKSTLNRTGTNMLLGSVEAIEENLQLENSLEFNQPSQENKKKKNGNPFISMIGPFNPQELKKRQTMDIRFLKKTHDDFTDFDSDMNSVGMNSGRASINMHSFQIKREVLPKARKSELFTRFPHFPQVKEKKSPNNSKERRLSMNKVGLVLG